jgi:hypothetical protein
LAPGLTRHSVLLRETVDFRKLKCATLCTQAHDSVDRNKDQCRERLSMFPAGGWTFRRPSFMNCPGLDRKSKDEKAKGKHKTSLASPVYRRRSWLRSEDLCSTLVGYAMRGSAGCSQLDSAVEQTHGGPSRLGAKESDWKRIDCRKFGPLDGRDHGLAGSDIHSRHVRSCDVAQPRSRME